MKIFPPPKKNGWTCYPDNAFETPTTCIEPLGIQPPNSPTFSICRADCTHDTGSRLGMLRNLPRGWFWIFGRVSLWNSWCFQKKNTWNHMNTYRKNKHVTHVIYKYERSHLQKNHRWNFGSFGWPPSTRYLLLKFNKHVAPEKLPKPNRIQRFWMDRWKTPRRTGLDDIPVEEVIP